MKKVLFLVSAFCFLAVSSAVAQKTEVKKTEEIKKIETTTAQPSEKQTRAEKSEVKLVPTKKVVEVKKNDSSRKIEATKVQKTVVPARKREEKKEK